MFNNNSQRKKYFYPGMGTVMFWLTIAEIAVLVVLLVAWLL